MVTLARQLEGDTAEGPASAADIGDTMKRLGAHTAEAADTIDEDHLKDPLRRLGGYVKAAGIALSGGSRPDEIAGVSTDLEGTPGDPELRTVNSAPDVSGEALDPDRAGAKDRSGDVGEIAETPGRPDAGDPAEPVLAVRHRDDLEALAPARRLERRGVPRPLAEHGGGRWAP